MQITTGNFLGALLLAGAVMVPLDSRAQGAATPAAGMDISADKLEYRNEVMVGAGNLRMRRGPELLTADYGTYNDATGETTVRGNVHYENSLTGQRFDGDELQGNFRTQQWDFGFSELRQGLFTVFSESSEVIEPGLQRLENAMVTTCDAANPEFYIRAREAMVYDRSIVRARSAVFYLNNIPFLYLPRWTVDLQRDETNFDFLPGYSSRHGAYALSGYSYPLLNTWATTRLDYRSKRGLGIGEDLAWEGDSFKGKLRTYFLNDDKLYRDAKQEPQQEDVGREVPESSRYRVRLSHYQSISPRDQLFIEAGKLSDPEVTLDFFDDEYRVMPVQENRLSYTHNDNDFTAGVELHKNLNDAFFSGVDRLPEATLSVPRLRIGGSPFYYEGFHRAGILAKVYSEREQSLGKTNYETQRIHSRNTVYYPSRHMGFLNLIPRIGFTGTFYADTLKKPDVFPEPPSTTDDDDDDGNDDSPPTETTVQGADIRDLFETGFKTSFKAFRVMHNEPTSMGVGMRHVVEPFANYSYIREPGLRPPHSIHQFDGIDRLDRLHNLQFGLRNKWQTKRPVMRPNPLNRDKMESYNRLIDLVDVSVSTTYWLEPEDNPEAPEDNPEALGHILVDGEFRPTDYLQIDTRASYNVAASEFSRINTEVQFMADDRSHVSIDHSYRLGRNHVLQAEYSLWPRAILSLEGYSRFEIEQGEFEEQVLLFTYRTDCVGYGLGGRWIAGDDDIIEEDDEWQVWGQIWLTAFPQGIVEMGK